MNVDQAQADWELPEGLSLVRDSVLDRNVLETAAGQSLLVSRREFAGPYEVSLLLRIPAPVAYAAALHCGLRNRDLLRNPNYTLLIQDAAYSLMSSDGSGFYPSEGGGPVRDLLRPKDEPAGGRAAGTVFRSRFANTSPVWDEEYRQEMESVIDANPVPGERWSRWRVVVWNDRAELYVNEICLGEYRPALAVRGAVALRVMTQVRIGALTVRRLTPAQQHFCTVDLAARANAAALAGEGVLSLGSSALPPPGRVVGVEGIPFLIGDRAGGRDHVDVGLSLFHYRKTVNNPDMSTLWPAATSFDSGRIMLTVPNRAYSRAWIVAACDDGANSVPVVTLRFFRPQAGFTVDGRGEVPAFTASSGRAMGARRLRVTDPRGKRRSLWLVPISLDSQRIASDQREHKVLSVEITKEVHPYRNCPDPCDYGYFQGGVPSSVRIFALTFEEAPVKVITSGNRTGNVYILPEAPVWQVDVTGLRDGPVEGTLHVETTDPYGASTSVAETPVAVSAKGTARFEFPLLPAVLGFHRVRTEFRVSSGAAGGPETYAQEGAFVQVAEDIRKADQTNSRWGFWNWLGGHGTNPDKDENAYLMRACGARGSMSDYPTRKKWGLFPWPTYFGVPAWAWEDPYDPQAYTNYSREMGEQVLKYFEDNPDGTYFCYFAENAVSLSATYGTYPEYIGEGERVWTEQEQKTIRAYTLGVRSAFEGIRKAAPHAKLSFGWCSPQFIVPFLRNQFPKELFDVIGLDVPTFERMPEAPAVDVNPNKMWFLQEELKKNGYPRIPIIHSESYFPSSHELALGHRVSADYYVRTAVLSLALGTTRQIACFSLFDCSNYWGAQHYGCNGVVGRRPEYNPKPAYAAYATMTRLLDLVEFDGHVPAGSISTYCVRFKNLDRTRPHNFVYCLWTLRGERDAVLVFQAGADVPTATRIDENGNERQLAPVESRATVRIAQTPVWVTSDVPLEEVDPGVPRYAEAPGPHTMQLDPLDEAWTYEAGDYPAYSKAYPVRFITYPGPMRQEIVDSPERQAKVWRVALETPEKERAFAGWFGVFRPQAPIDIPGRARALGIWAKGCSDWGRIVYEIRDANGETFLSVGAAESWNSNDNYHWSCFNFDGWRYIEFPLPNNLAGDAYREKDSVWWGHDREGVVDLPVTLTGVIIEHRTHNVYVDELVTSPETTVDLDNLLAVYESPEMMTDAPVNLQRGAAIRFTPRDGSSLPNPLSELSTKSEVAPTVIESFSKPEAWYDGKQITVQAKAVEEATEYRVYVSSYENGAGAAVLAKGKEPVLQVNGLRPEYPLYFAVTYVGANGKESKPSPVRRLLLKDDFPYK